MEIFNLPDLGEGLPDAEIHEWYVKEGDMVQLDQPVVSMETAKAVVDVPSPQAGTIVKCYGKPGTVIKTGHPLIAFEISTQSKKDKGTVVGTLEQSHEAAPDNFIIRSNSSANRPKATPAVRTLAKKLGVDLSTLTGSGEHGLITKEDVEISALPSPLFDEGFEPLHGVRRAMYQSMVESHKQVVPVTIFDETDIHAWESDEDITVRLILAIIEAAHQEPALNAWFNTDNKARKCFNEVHLGLAMDSEEGLFVPVISNSQSMTNTSLRDQINILKTGVLKRNLPQETFKGATFTLSNFGKFAGRFASPIIVPPMVAILAVGRSYDAIVSVDGKPQSHRLIPLSLSFDHRAVTGGEATRFLGIIKQCLEKGNSPGTSSQTD